MASTLEVQNPSYAGTNYEIVKTEGNTYSQNEDLKSPKNGKSGVALLKKQQTFKNSHDSFSNASVSKKPSQILNI